jgi:hypothetical protein
VPWRFTLRGRARPSAALRSAPAGTRCSGSSPRPVPSASPLRLVCLPSGARAPLPSCGREASRLPNTKEREEHGEEERHHHPGGPCNRDPCLPRKQSSTRRRRVSRAASSPPCPWDSSRIWSTRSRALPPCCHTHRRDHRHPSRMPLLIGAGVPGTGCAHAHVRRADPPRCAGRSSRARRARLRTAFSETDGHDVRLFADEDGRDALADSP